MNLSPPKLTVPFRRGRRRGDAVPDADTDACADTVQMPVREPEDEGRVDAEPPDLGWRSSSYDLKHGLDVVELPTSLPIDVLDRLFKAPDA
jgi:hypothetical protein